MKTLGFGLLFAMNVAVFTAAFAPAARALTPEEARAHMEQVIAAMKARQAALATTTHTSDGAMTADSTDSGGGLDYGPMDASPNGYGSNDLWLSITLTNDPFSGAPEVSLTLHGTYTNYWQLQSKRDLDDPLWTPGQIIPDTDGTNQITFDPVPTDDPPQNFFRGVGGDTVVSIFAQQDAIETNYDTGDPGQVGIFYVYATNSVERELTVFYRTSGSAVNGVDYTNLPGSLTISPGGVGEIDIQPIRDFCVDFDESVAITLEYTNTSGYLIDPVHGSATIVVRDNLGTNIFQPVVTNLNQPIGIDYHAPSNSLIVSYNYNVAGFLGTNFLRIYTTNSASPTNTVVTNWSFVSFLPEEVKLATVKQTVAGFTNGDMYFSSGTAIGWLSADATRSNLTWCTLTNDVVANAQNLRGGLYLDQTGVWSNDLIAVTSDSAYDDTQPKGVWRVNSRGSPKLVANILTPHLEGVITLPDNVTNWGPWAGKIITGDELLRVIYAIGTNGVVETYATTNFFPLGIQPEDFDIIETNQNLYACDPDAGQVVKLSESLLRCHIGKLTITSAGEFGPPGPALYILNWDGSKFATIAMLYTNPSGYPGHFEHVTFAPVNLPPMTQ